MSVPVPLLPARSDGNAARVAVFMSGSGSNAEALLRYSQKPDCAFKVVVIVTDRPRRCRAQEIAEKWGLPLLECDIFAFYAAHGEAKIQLDTPKRRQLRESWNARLTEQVRTFRPDFGVLAGFIPLLNLAGTLPLLNVHPGDLTIIDADGRRRYAGLHFLPVEQALCDGRRFLRSSVILAQPYTHDGADELDSGWVLGLSAPVAVPDDTPDAPRLRQLQAQRPGKVVSADDPLRSWAKKCIETLKRHGDHQVLPRCVEDFARGAFAASGGQLYYRPTAKDGFSPVAAIEYADWESAARPILAN